MTARPRVTVYDDKNESTKNEIKLPAVFKAPIRPDVVSFIHDQLRKNKRQPYAVSKLAGSSVSVKYSRIDSSLLLSFFCSSELRLN